MLKSCGNWEYPPKKKVNFATGTSGVDNHICSDLETSVPPGDCSHGLLTPWDINTSGRDIGPLQVGKRPEGTRVCWVEQWQTGSPGSWAKQKYRPGHKASHPWEMCPYRHFSCMTWLSLTCARGSLVTSICCLLKVCNGYSVLGIHFFTALFLK